MEAPLWPSGLLRHLKVAKNTKPQKKNRKSRKNLKVHLRRFSDLFSHLDVSIVLSFLFEV
jgi:hypothetical protein